MKVMRNAAKPSILPLTLVKEVAFSPCNEPKILLFHRNPARHHIQLKNENRKKRKGNLETGLIFVVFGANYQKREEKWIH